MSTHHITSTAAETDRLLALNDKMNAFFAAHKRCERTQHEAGNECPDCTLPAICHEY